MVAEVKRKQEKKEKKKKKREKRRLEALAAAAEEVEVGGCQVGGVWEGSGMGPSPTGVRQLGHGAPWVKHGSC